MKILPILIIAILLLVPVFVLADCSKSGTTVIFINGVFGTEKDAKLAKDSLEYQYKIKGESKNVNFINGFNSSHVAGVDDLINSVTQAYAGGYLDYDLTTILRQVHTDLNTQNILLVGHSQGTFYTNAAYQYLIQNGVDKNSIAVYNVATPADTVAGDGGYLTSSTDKVINAVVRTLTGLGFAKTPLAANITLPLSPDEESNPLGGHDFSNVYLAEAPDRIIGDMDREIGNLQNNNADKSECFVEPKADLAYWIEDTGYKTADQAIAYFDETPTSPLKSPEQAASVADAIFESIYQFGKSLVLNIDKNIANAGSGSVMNGYPAADSDTSGNVVSNNVPDNSQNSSAALNPPDTSNESSSDGGAAPQEDTQDRIDDIKEKIDILNAQVAKLIAQQNPAIELADVKKDQTPEDDNNQDDNQNNDTQNSNTNTGGSLSYPKILISEVQTSGVTDAKQEFVELYNPNNQQVDLTNWYLQRKTASSSDWVTYAPNTLFAEKTIPANGYFLIARTGYYVGTADIFTDNPITNDNSFALKDPRGNISDKVGFGNATDPELVATANPGTGQSIGRKVLEDGTEQDFDNNGVDFELQTPTPKSKNITYIAPLQAAPTDETAPQVAFSLNPVQVNVNFAVNFTITDPLETVSPSGISSYVFRWQAAGDASWQQDSPVTITGAPSVSAQTRNFTGQDGKTYNFQVQATDVAGNISDWEPEIPASTEVDTPKKILINEIQTAGKTTKDEFIELYNPNTVDVNLKGFNLTKKTSGGTESNLVSSSKFSGTIPALGFFLIVPPINSDGSANYTGFATPDLYYSGSTFSLASDNTVLLYNNSGILLDKVGFGAAKDFETAPAANPSAGQSIERVKLGVDTDNNAADFKISDEPTPKAASPKSYIEDDTDYANCMTTSDPGATFYNLDIKWHSSSSNLDHFQTQYQLNGGTWQDWSTTTTDTEGKFQTAYSLYNDKIYIFRVRAYDKNGNAGSWAEVSVDVANPVVINEVAFYGVGDSSLSHKQWMELYNRSGSPIALDGWKLSSGNYLDVTLQGTIPANGYFILERKDDNSVSDVAADQTFTGVIPTGSAIYLTNANNRQIDQINNNWSQGRFIEHGNYYSLERISPYSFGQDPDNWGLSQSPAFGTPSLQNSNYQFYTSNFSNSFVEDTTLKKSLSPYLFNDSISVFPGITLTIEPGVVIKFEDTSLTVDGTIEAIGDVDEPIIFTSIDDTDYGGDIRTAGNTTPAVPGQWAGILFKQDSMGSDLENIIERYGGSNLGLSSHSSGIRVDQAAITLKNSTIEQNSNFGILLTNSDSTIDSVQFLNNSTTDYQLIHGQALRIEGGSPTISHCSFKENYESIFITDTGDVNSPTVTNNDFENNYDAINLNGHDIHANFSGDTASNNESDAIIFADEVSQNLTIQPDLPYLFQTRFTVPPSVTVTIQPGTVIKCADSEVVVDGTLQAVGTSDQPIVFTSIDDDEYGGDIRAVDDNAVSVSPGQWSGILFNPDSINSDLENVVVRYAGGYLGGYVGGGIAVDQSVIVLKNATIQDNLGSGVNLTDSDSTIDSVQFLDNKSINNSPVVSGLYLQGASPEVKNSHFDDNNYGIYINDLSGDIATPDFHSIDPLDPEQNTFGENTIQDAFDNLAPV